MENNNVFNVIVIHDSADPNPNSTVGDIVVGATAVVEFGTGKILTAEEDLTSAQKINVFGKRSDGDLNKSAGLYIDKSLITGVEQVNYIEGKPMIVKIHGYKPSARTEYILGINFHNSEIMDKMNRNLVFPKYHVTTSCCGENCSCPDGNCNDLTRLFVDKINNDTKRLATAVAYATEALTTATHGVSQNYAVDDEILREDLDILVEWNNNQEEDDTKVCTGIKITTNTAQVKDYCINTLNYVKLRETTMQVVAVGDLACSTTVEIVQEMTYEQGSGADVRAMEAFAGGWNGNPGANRMTGEMGQYPVHYEAKLDKNYNLYTVSYKVKSESGSLAYSNDFNTIFAVDTELDAQAALGYINSFLNSGFNSGWFVAQQ